MEYTIIEQDSAMQLVAWVERMITEGWAPLGGVTCAVWSETTEDRGGCTWAQAMTKDILPASATPGHPATPK
jgi:hypothetical protein